MVFALLMQARLGTRLESGKIDCAVHMILGKSHPWAFSLPQCSPIPNVVGVKLIYIL